MRATTNTSEGIKLSPTLWLVDATNCGDIVNSTWLREILDTSLQKSKVINHIAQSRTGVSFQYVASHWYASIMIIKPKNGEIFHEEVCQVLTLVKLSFFVAIRPLTMCKIIKCPELVWSEKNFKFVEQEEALYLTATTPTGMPNILSWWRKEAYCSCDQGQLKA